MGNLRILCGHCHSQTSNYCGKNIKTNYPKVLFFCLDCEIEIKYGTKRCKLCHIKRLKVGLPKIDWPSNEELETMVWNKPTSSIAKQLDASDSAVSKRCKKLGIKKPSRGYWAKKAAEINPVIF